MDTVFLVGPTAVGKTAVAHELAPLLGAEIVSADSMQVYRGMDIGTAKDKSARLVDVCDIGEPFDVKRYVELAQALIATLESVIVCGGTGLYIRALRRGLFEGPGRNPDLRAKLETLAPATLYEQLRRVDPVTAATIDRRNPRRLVRALEVFHATGRSIRELQTQEAPSGVVFGLNRARDDLYARIERRIEQQIASGWVEEVRQLMKRGLHNNPTAMQAAGYRELVAHVRGELSLAEAVALIKTRTRQLARRQLTWFRREPGIIWLDVRTDEPASQTARRIYQRIEDA